MNWNDKVVLITGGTGSFGKKFTKILLEGKGPKKVIIFSPMPGSRPTAPIAGEPPRSPPGSRAPSGGPG